MSHKSIYIMCIRVRTFCRALILLFFLRGGGFLFSFQSSAFEEVQPDILPNGLPHCEVPAYNIAGVPTHRSGVGHGSATASPKRAFAGGRSEAEHNVAVGGSLGTVLRLCAAFSFGSSFFLWQTVLNGAPGIQIAVNICPHCQ